MHIPSIISLIVSRINAAGGSTLLVGGAVRDLILGRQPKDYDLEVFGVDGETAPELDNEALGL